MLLVLEQDPVPPRMLNPKRRPRPGNDLPDVPAEAGRPALSPSAADLADDLEAYLDDEAISARSGGFGRSSRRMLRETHHAAVLENWGLLWMWHSLMVFLLCLLTQVHELARRRRSHVYYFAAVDGGLATWAAIFWALRRRAGR